MVPTPNVIVQPALESVHRNRYFLFTTSAQIPNSKLFNTIYLETLRSTAISYLKGRQEDQKDVATEVFCFSKNEISKNIISTIFN